MSLISMYFQCKVFYNINQPEIMVWMIFKVGVIRVKYFNLCDNFWLTDCVKILYTDDTYQLNL